MAGGAGSRARSASGAREWNDFAVRRMVAELRAPGTVLGIHPEGERRGAGGRGGVGGNLTSRRAVAGEGGV